MNKELDKLEIEELKEWQLWNETRDLIHMENIVTIADRKIEILTTSLPKNDNIQQ